MVEREWWREVARQLNEKREREDLQYTRGGGHHSLLCNGRVGGRIY